MKERLQQPFNGPEPLGQAPDQRVCVYCGNRHCDVCAGCSTEGKYRSLSPERLPRWENLPDLPKFEELLELPAAARLAFVYVGLYYLREQEVKE